jgi:hypothetical protein
MITTADVMKAIQTDDIQALKTILGHSRNWLAPKTVMETRRC